MIILYRLKDEATRAQFAVNLHRRRPVRVFRKISRGVVELGDFYVTGFEPIQPGDEPSFGSILHERSEFLTSTWPGAATNMQLASKGAWAPERREGRGV